MPARQEARRQQGWWRRCWGCWPRGCGGWGGGYSSLPLERPRMGAGRADGAAGAAEDGCLLGGRGWVCAWELNIYFNSDLVFERWMRLAPAPRDHRCRVRKKF